MPKSPSRIASGILPATVFIACLAVCGCEKTEQIVVYTVPKHSSLQTPEYLAAEDARHPKPVPKRMIGVVIPKAPQLWFLKLEGDVDAVAARENDVREFLKTAHFVMTGVPPAETLEWTLPAGWRQLPGTELRHATLVLDGQPALEMSVSKFPLQPDQELSNQVLMNINRWRGQLSLSPIEMDELEKQVEKLTLADSVVYWVNLKGTAVPKPVGKAPPHPPVAPPSKQAADAKQNPQAEALTYQKPAEWDEAAPTMFAKLSFQVRDGEKKVAITVTPAKGSRDMNVNRWRGQVKLDELNAEQLAAAAKKVDVGTGVGDLFEMTNDGQTILGVIVEDNDQTWFVKLFGDSQLAERERPRFVEFLKSLQLGKGR